MVGPGQRQLPRPSSWRPSRSAPDGYLQLTRPIPEGVRTVGSNPPHKIRAVGTSTSKEANVTIAASFVLDPDVGGAGTPVEVELRGFAADEDVVVTWPDYWNAPCPSPTYATISPGGFGTDGRGSAQFTYVVPISASDGFHTVTANGQQTDLSDGFTVEDGETCQGGMLVGGGGEPAGLAVAAVTSSSSRPTRATRTTGGGAATGTRRRRSRRPRRR